MRYMRTSVVETRKGIDGTALIARSRREDEMRGWRKG